MKKLCLFALLAISIRVFGQTGTKTITIQPKQTLYAIAREYNTTAAELKKLNPQYAPDYQMKIGAKFVVPVASSATATPTPTVKPVTIAESVKPVASTEVKTIAATTATHVVEKGETLYSIAKKYEMQAKELFALNNLTAKSTVKIGQKLKVTKRTITTETVKQPAPATTTEAVYKPVETVVPAKKEEAKENVPSDNIATVTKTTTNNVAPANTAAVKKTPAATTKNIVPVAGTPTVVSSKFQTEFNTSVNPNTKRTLRGIAKVVNNSELTSSSFVLYNYAEEGDIVKVVNLMTKKVMYLKVVGKTENPGEEIILQVSFDTAKMLQANENRFLVEVTGY